MKIFGKNADGELVYLHDFPFTPSVRAELEAGKSSTYEVPASIVSLVTGVQEARSITIEPHITYGDSGAIDVSAIIESEEHLALLGLSVKQTLEMNRFKNEFGEFRDACFGDSVKSMA